MKYLVFYAGLLYGEYSRESFGTFKAECTPEVYNGGYIYLTGERWYRMDFTPVLDVDVPLNLKAMLLLLT